MKKQTVCRAAILAVLSILVIIVGWLAFCPQGSPMNPLSLSAPVATSTPAPTAPLFPESITPQELPPAPSAQPEKMPAATPAPAETKVKEGMLGTLTINKKGISVADNVDENTLKGSPGWMPDSAPLGEDGMSVILGHRNRTHLRVLRDVKIGDSILFTYADGRTFEYAVTGITIFENSADWRLPATEGNTLVLVTCYPFQYSGDAPGKYQVVCTQM